jgi:hypothetical protein
MVVGDDIEDGWGGDRAEVEGSEEGMQKGRSGGEVQPKVGRGERRCQSR